MAADAAVAYLEIALEAAKNGEWAKAGANGFEGAKYCNIAGKLGPTPTVEEPADA